jgi:hypothetical protein
MRHWMVQKVKEAQSLRTEGEAFFSQTLAFVLTNLTTPQKSQTQIPVACTKQRQEKRGSKLNLYLCLPLSTHATSNFRGILSCKLLKCSGLLPRKRSRTTNPSINQGNKRNQSENEQKQQQAGWSTGLWRVALWLVEGFGMV